MNIKVVYHSMTGNTKKIAEAIAEEAGICAERVTDYIPSEAVDILFIGDGNYVSSIHNSTKKFVSKLNQKEVRNVAVFGTYGGMDNAIPKLKAILRKNGLNVIEEYFSCKGTAWAVINKSHPDENDVGRAKEFAQKVINDCRGSL